MDKKNITLAFSEVDYNYLVKLKKELRVKSFTQLVEMLLYFYKDNKDKKDENNIETQQLEKTVDELSTSIDKMKSTMVTEKELSYLVTSIELIKQNYDIVHSLMNKMDGFQETLVKEKDHNELMTRVANIEKRMNTILKEAIDEGKLLREEQGEIKALIRAKDKLTK